MMIKYHFYVGMASMACAVARRKLVYRVFLAIRVVVCLVLVVLLLLFMMLYFFFFLFFFFKDTLFKVGHE